MNTNLRNVCFSFCLCLVAALASAAPFSSPHGYSLTLPPGWHVEAGGASGDSDDRFSLAPSAAHAPGTGTPNMDVSAQPMQGGVALEDFKKLLGPLYKKKFPGIVIVSQTYSTVGGVRGLDTVFIKPQSGLKVRVRQIYALKSGSLYIFTAAYPEKVHAKYDPIISQMLSSVHWKA